jgi:NADH dehydrogenase [ubiquinone] 1 alpha subcomplex assembly factor 2
MRRIVKYPPSTPYSEIKVSPQWHQWLRHTRQHPPSITEQSQDLVRQENLKILTAQTNARWAGKQSLLDTPGSSRVIPGLVEQRGSQEPRDQNVVAGSGTGLSGVITKGSYSGATENERTQHGGRVSEKQGHNHDKLYNGTETQGMKHTENPWKHLGGTKEEWQPKTWEPNISVTR